MFKKLAIVLLIFISFTGALFAQDSEATFYLSPNSGWIKHEEEFEIDIFIDTKGQEISLARAALTFDPSIIQVVEAQRNEELFCDWPSDEQLIDNQRGIVVATGFCNDPLYATRGDDADIFARLKIEPLREHDLRLFWEYSGRNEPAKTVMMEDGSPPQNILTEEMLFEDEDATAGDYVISLTDPGIDATTPDTGLFSHVGTALSLSLGIGLILMSAGAYIFFNPSRKYFNNSKTKVVYGDEKD